MIEDANDLPLLIDSRAACEMLFGSADRKHFYRLYEMIEREEIGATRLGDRWFIPKNSMKKFIDEQSG